MSFYNGCEEISPLESQIRDCHDPLPAQIVCDQQREWAKGLAMTVPERHREERSDLNCHAQGLLTVNDTCQTECDFAHISVPFSVIARNEAI